MKTIKRRRQENKTDYKARLFMLKSGKTRFVIRKTNKYIIVQAVESDAAQDKIIVGVSSRDLSEQGWPKENSGSLKSLGAAYLTGILLGKKLAGKVKEGIIDLGMQRNIKKSRIYAALRGLIDAGIKIPHSKDVLPTDEDLKKNENVGKLVDKLKEKLK